MANLTLSPTVDIGDMVAGLAFLIAAFELWRNVRTRKVEMFNSVRQKIQEMSLTYGSEYINKSATEKAVWDGVFFSELEWMSLLLRRHELPSELVMSHYGASVLGWYEGIFLRFATREDLDDPDAYSEFKGLVVELKRRASARQTLPAGWVERTVDSAYSTLKGLIAWRDVFGAPSRASSRTP